MDSLDLARADLGIKNLEVTLDSTGHCTFDFVVPHTFEIEPDQGDYSDDAIVARNGINRICLSGVVDPKRRADSDWLFFLYPGKVCYVFGVILFKSLHVEFLNLNNQLLSLIEFLESVSRNIFRSCT